MAFGAAPGEIGAHFVGFRGVSRVVGREAERPGAIDFSAIAQGDANGEVAGGRELRDQGGDNGLGAGLGVVSVVNDRLLRRHGSCSEEEEKERRKQPAHESHDDDQVVAGVWVWRVRGVALAWKGISSRRSCTTLLVVRPSTRAL